MTIGLGYIFNASENCLGELSTGIEYTPNKRLSYNIYMGTYYTAGLTVNGTNDRVAVRMMNYATGNVGINYPAPYSMYGNGAGGNGLVLDSSGHATFGETLWVENIRKPMVKYRTSKSKPYDGSLDDDGFIPSASNTKLVGKVLLAENWSILPGYVCYAYNLQGAA